MAKREVRILVRKKETVGNILPSDAFLAEPFVNTYEGRLFFSGTSGGSYEPVEGQTNVFEVGSTVATLKALSGINLNNLFIATGTTGQIITYEGVSDMSGLFLSGTSNGLTLAPISEIVSVQDVTRVQPGVNITTGGTANAPIVSVVSSPGFDDLTVSGNTDLNVLSADTIFSGSTDLYNIFQVQGSDANKTYVQPGLNTYTGGTADAPTVNVTGGTFYDLTITALTAGRVVYVGTGGQLVDEAGFEYNQSTNTLLAENITTNATGTLFVGTGGAVIGSGGDPGTPGAGDLTIHGNLIIYGAAVSAHTSQLYIEDNTIELNYNPTADTSSTSLGAGWIIQDGSGTQGTDVYLDIRGSAATIYDRSFATNLYDIRIRESGSTASPNGVRVLAEYDILDGGSF